MKKRILSAFLAVALTVSNFSAVASVQAATSASTGNQLEENAAEVGLKGAELVSTTSALVKEAGYQSFPTYYSETRNPIVSASRYLPGQVTHPDVVVFEEPWNNYKYWAVYTPNVTGFSGYENASIVASTDGKNWIKPGGTNLIDVEPTTSALHNCDADMVYNPKLNALMAYWNWANDGNAANAEQLGAQVRMKISYDGVNWGIPTFMYDSNGNFDPSVDLYSHPEVRTVKKGDNEFFRAVKSRNRYDMLSPTFTYDSFRDVFVMYANNTKDVGYNNGQKNYVEVRYSKDGINWSEPTKINNFLGKNANNQQLAPWHQDISYVKELNSYIGISQCFAGGSPDGSVLYMTTSKDGVNWTPVGTSPILSPGTGNTDWDNFQIYRSSFYYEPGTKDAQGKEITPGSGKFRLWYSALQQKAQNDDGTVAANSVGKKVQDATGALTLTGGTGDSRIWRIGYAENLYLNTMKVLTGDPSYSVPAYVKATALSITTDLEQVAGKHRLSIGQTGKLSATITPAEATKPAVKYTVNEAGKSIVTVEADGSLTPLKVGSATITGTLEDGSTNTLTVEVYNTPVSGINWDLPATKTVYQGEKIQINTTIAPADASNKGITYTTTNANAVTVSDTGLISVVGAGSATITATAAGDTTKKVQITLTTLANEAELIAHSNMTATATSEKNPASGNDGPASYAIDASNDTMWHTNYPSGGSLPQSITLTLDGKYKINKLDYLGRGANNGTITKYEIYAITETGEKLVASGNWEKLNTVQSAVFAPVEASAIRLKAIEGHGNFGAARNIDLYKLKGSASVPIAVTSVSITPQTANVGIGETTKLTAAVLPAIANQEVTWSSSDNQTATVVNGVVTGVKAGTATITATSKVDATKKATATVTIAAFAGKELVGNGVTARFNEATGKVTLMKTGNAPVKMSNESSVGYLLKADNIKVDDFANATAVVQTGITGLMGAGNRMTITSTSTSTGIKRVYVMETSNALEGVIYTKTSYTGGTTALTPAWFVDNNFYLADPASTIWSYNGGGEGAQSWYDTLQKISTASTATFSRENKQDYTSAAIPVADIYSENGGITVGDASPTRREVRTPVMKEAGDTTANISIKWPGQALTAGKTIEVGQSIINVHRSDYYMGLKGWQSGMNKVGVTMIDQEQIHESSYSLRWESWGWEFAWTIDKIVGKLDQLKAMGIKQITLDDGWYTNAGDWELNPGKFPNGEADMKRLVNEIHARGMTAILWWRPADGGRTASNLYKNHPEYFIKNQDGSFGKLAGPGGYNGFNGSTGFALCPSSEGAIQSNVAFVTKALRDWGFDGFKDDYLWSAPKCYNPAHNHARPEESTEGLAKFYQKTYEAMKTVNPNVFRLVCNCGTPQDYYSLPYVTQIPTADPTSVDQTRRRVKAYKALMGDKFPVTTDHNEIWYPSSVGTGGVLIEKRAFEGDAQATNLANYTRWLKIADTVQLHKGTHIGDLYSYGFDPYETYAIEKDNVMYYAFYKDGKYKPSGTPNVELKGLDASKTYRIVDYVNDRVLATNLKGDAATFAPTFTEGKYMLVKAVEITTPDPGDGGGGVVTPPTPTEEVITVDDDNAEVKYTGNWTKETNNAAYSNTAHYSNTVGAVAEFTFTGTGVAWFGQKETNFGTAKVYIDGVLKQTVNANGAAAMQQELYKVTGLANGSHTIKIEVASNTIDIDKFVYYKGTDTPPEVTVIKTELAAAYAIGSGYTLSNFSDEGSAKDQFSIKLEMAKNANVNVDSSQIGVDEARSGLVSAMLGLRKNTGLAINGTVTVANTTVSAVKKENLGDAITYATAMNKTDLQTEVADLIQTKLTAATTVKNKATATQNEVNKAFAELVNAVQYGDYKKSAQPPTPPTNEEKVTLQTEVNAAKAAYKDKKDLYTPASYAEYEAKLQAAEAVLASEEADAKRIDEALLELRAAIAGLEEANPHKDALQAEVDTVKAAYKDKKDSYPATLFAEYEAKLAAAEAVIADATSTDAKFDAALAALKVAVKALEDYVPATGKNGWVKENNKDRYYLNNVLKANFWVKEGTKWLYTDKEGYKVFGWAKYNSKWYYMGTDGYMKTGWLKNGGAWYYLQSSGLMKTGWLKDGGAWYYLQSSGKMKTGWVKDGTSWYYLLSSGKMKTGWLKDRGVWYYLQSSGKMKTGWLKDGGAWYYLQSSGKMKTGWVKVSDKWYYLESSGKMKTGWLSLSGKWYYLHTSGVMATNWTKVGGLEYYMNPTSGIWNGQSRAAK